MRSITPLLSANDPGEAPLKGGHWSLTMGVGITFTQAWSGTTIAARRARRLSRVREHD